MRIDTNHACGRVHRRRGHDIRRHAEGMGRPSGLSFGFDSRLGDDGGSDALTPTLISRTWLSWLKRDLAKVEIAGSSPAVRSMTHTGDNHRRQRQH